MQATKILPPDYANKQILNLSNRRTMVWLNLAALPLLFLFGWVFSRLMSLLRPDNIFPNGFWGILTTFSVLNLIVLIACIAAMLIAHELIHGSFFWLFTKERPNYALRSGYAFAAAPEWYLPKLQYVSVGLSPLVVISFLCLLLGTFIPVRAAPYLLVIATFNAAGALGDMIVVAWVSGMPKDCLVKDEGDQFYAYSQSIK
jgi:hypothetical protein